MTILWEGGYVNFSVFLASALGEDERSVTLHGNVTLWERAPWYPLDGKLGGPHSQSGRYGDVQLLDPTGTRTPPPRSSSQ
jgi:hypothetical protein